MSRWQPLSESLNPDVRLFVESAWHRYLDGSKFPPRQAVETLGILAGADAARRAPVGELRAGDRVVFALAGARLTPDELAWQWEPVVNAAFSTPTRRRCKPVRSAGPWRPGRRGPGRSAGHR
jgi:hypothetical protein